MRHVGIDYSMTCPAICQIGAAGIWKIDFLTDKEKYVGYFANRRIHGHPAPFSWKSETERYKKIASWAIKTIGFEQQDEPINKIFLEGYSMGSRGAIFNIAECAGTLKFMLFELDHIPIILPPTTVKKHATGKGSGKKELMGKAFFDKTGIDLAKEMFYDGRKLYDSSPFSDIADCYHVTMCGIDSLILDI